jgi:hypothetical protein
VAAVFSESRNRYLYDINENRRDYVKSQLVMQAFIRRFVEGLPPFERSSIALSPASARSKMESHP